MNKSVIPAIVALALALVVAVGSQGFIGPCVHEDGSFGACHWAGQAILGVGGLLAALAVLAIAVPAARFGLYVSMLPASLLGLLIPGTLIDLCGMATMRCRMVMQPAARLLFALAFAAGLAGTILARGRSKAA